MTLKSLRPFWRGGGGGVAAAWRGGFFDGWVSSTRSVLEKFLGLLSPNPNETYILRIKQRKNIK